MAWTPQLNNQARWELKAIADALGHTNLNHTLNHTLNLLITDSFKRIVRPRLCETAATDVRSTTTQ
jgi:hypothetical protein